MTIMLVQHKVKNFADWKKVFDSALEIRKSSGELSVQIYQDASDPSKLTLVNKWDSLANAQKFAHSPELKAAMEQAGLQGPPVITFLNEV
jgi:quinol monooxygenase YgiN